MDEATAPSADIPRGPPMTQGEREALRVAVQQCWNVGSLSSEALRTTVVVSVNYRLCTTASGVFACCPCCCSCCPMRGGCGRCRGCCCPPGRLLALPRS